MERPELPYVVESMRVEDVPEVVELESLAFPSPWPARAYRYEVTQNSLAHYYVARRQLPEGPDQAPEEEGSSLLRRIQTWILNNKRDNRPLVGYCGFWIAAHEAHISTIAVDPGHRGRGIGQLLLMTTIEEAIDLNAALMSLEVRVSNFVAQNLYRKYGFAVVGRRPRYYSDNREDALIMTTDHINSPPYQRMFQKRRKQLLKRLEWKTPVLSEE
ncbi:MAG TPA: ribosomal protein S18-alanine N-acetyltransferase [Anaerolineae bacterium]|nr:ribosomal protein S18-alanine N-acetyltransferase [Anaerolineae bacterium]